MGLENNEAAEVGANENGGGFCHHFAERHKKPCKPLLFCSAQTRFDPAHNK